MFALIHGPGGLAARSGAEAVPVVLGGVLGWLAGAQAGLLCGLAAGLLAWLSASALLVRVRARPRLRRLYRLALALHVVFWSARGVLDSPPRAPGPVGAPAVSRAGDPAPLRAGAAEVAVAVPTRVSLAGWGGSPRRRAVPAFGGLGPLGRLSLAGQASRGADGRARVPLLAAAEPSATPGPVARALVLRPEGEGPTLALVRLDLLTGDAALTEAVLSRVADLGVSRATLLVSATHTHSGLGGYARAAVAQVLATDHFDPEVFEALVAAATAAVREAHRTAVPARVALSEGADRGPDGATLLAVRRGRHRQQAAEARVGLLRVESLDGRTLAVLLSHGVHPVAMRPGHPALSRDLVGAVEQAVAARLPGAPAVLFLQSGLGDVSPRVTERAEDPGAIERAARAFAEALAPALAEPAAYDRLALGAAVVERPLGDPHAVACLGAREAFLDDVGPGPFQGPLASTLADVLLLPANVALWSLTLTDLRLAGTLRGAVGLRVNLARLTQPRAEPVGLVELSLGASGRGGSTRLSLAWLPGEPTQALAESWRGLLSGSGGARPWVLALTNGSLGYVVTAGGYEEGGYEALGTLHGRETARLLTEQLLAARAALR